VRLVLSDGQPQARFHQRRAGRSQEELEVDYSGDKLDIGFNVTYLLDVLNNLSPNETIDCRFNDGNSSALFVLPENDASSTS
jgi:DNA polymerase-3 subunit beta